MKRLAYRPYRAPSEVQATRNVALKGSVATEQVGAFALKDLTQPFVADNVPLAATHPPLRVIEGARKNL